ncbi:MAG: Sec-independent protein translocase protein TatB [Bdellovibrionota bacterium]
MFNLGIQELAVIFIIALVFIGPKQLPELAKTLGKVFRDFKRASNEITDSLQREARQVSDFKDDLKKDVTKDLDLQLLPETDSIARPKISDSKPLDQKPEAPSDDKA